PRRGFAANLGTGCSWLNSSWLNICRHPRGLCPVTYIPYLYTRKNNAWNNRPEGCRRGRRSAAAVSAARRIDEREGLPYNAALIARRRAKLIRSLDEPAKNRARPGESTP